MQDEVEFEARDVEVDYAGIPGTSTKFIAEHLCMRHLILQHILILH